MNDDLSGIFEKFNINKDSFSPEMIDNLKNILGNINVDNSNGYDTSNDKQASYNNFDFETILKMKSIIDKMNVKDDPRSNLLLSLKPYLKESRKSKIDLYIQLMNISRVMEVFPFMGGDSKNATK